MVSVLGRPIRQPGPVDGFSESLSKELLLEWNIKACPPPNSHHTTPTNHSPTGGFDTNTVMSPLSTPYTGTLTAILRDACQETSFDGDPYKFAETLYRLVDGWVDRE
ncbi:hypothetical protein HD554DRAFT_2172696 [Boletus coccyginus]|nr:hypothetical protein HD554DRAFT_2172696 [Boletus coccyginus]